MHFRMRPTKRLMESLAHHLAITNNDSTDHWVRLYPPLA
jgi:hypothetical protein